MALLDKLKQVRDVKTSYYTLQQRFYGEIFQRFPHVFKSDMAAISNMIQTELMDMLCLSMKYRSVKIPLKASARYGDGESFVNVQRGEQGFYYPQSQRGNSDIYYLNNEYYLKDNDDMYHKREESEYGSSNRSKTTMKNTLMVALSELRKPEHGPRMNADKLDAYFKILREVMAFKKYFLCYNNMGNEEFGRSFKAGGMRFDMGPKSFDILLPQKRRNKDDEEFSSHHYGRSEDSNFKYNPGSEDVLRLLDYSDDAHKSFGGETHYKLKLFIDNYDEIRDKLIVEEAQKKRVHDTCQSFVEQLRAHTVPFRVLGEITNK